MAENVQQIPWPWSLQGAQNLLPQVEKSEIFFDGSKGDRQPTATRNPPWCWQKQSYSWENIRCYSFSGLKKFAIQREHRNAWWCTDWSLPWHCRACSQVRSSVEWSSEKVKEKRPSTRVTHYLSQESQNEFIELCGDRVLKEILKERECAIYYLLICDATPDVSHKEQNVILLRYVAQK